MAALTGRTIRASYIELLKLNTTSTNTGVTGSLIDVTDGGDTASALSLSTSQIASSVDGSAGTAAFTRKGDTNTGVFFPTADTIAVTTNGTERLRIASSGNVGIGTTTPSGNLHVVSSVTGFTLNSTNLIFGALTGAATAAGQSSANFINNFNSATGIYLKKTGVGTGDYLAIEDSASNPILYVKTTGNVGIGTTTPTAQLELSTDEDRKSVV